MVSPVVIAPVVCVEWATDVAVHVYDSPAEQAVTVMAPSSAQTTVPPPV